MPVMPRVAPLEPEELDAEQRAALGPLIEAPELADAVQRPRPFNIFLTLARAPAALRGFLAWGDYILSSKNALLPRQREMAILRTGWNCRSTYEFGHHRRIGLAVGLDEAEVEAIKSGADAGNWDALERAILIACDELHATCRMNDGTWAALAPLGEKARMDLVMTVAQYTQVSMMLNAFGVELEDGQYNDPDLAG